MKSSDKPKAIIAVVILLAALGLIAYNLNLFGGGPTPTSTPVMKEGAPRGGVQMAPGVKAK